MNESPRISMIGLAGADLAETAENYPRDGGDTSELAFDRMPGGATANCAVAAARLGAEVSFIGRVGQDRAADELIAGLAGEGIDTSGLLTDSSLQADERVVITSGSREERTNLWRQGARISIGSRIDIANLFSAGICFVDVDDLPLYRFLADLPVHTNPHAKLLGSLTNLTESPETSLSEIIPRLDAVVGSSQDASAITGAGSTAEACVRCQQAMIGNNLRFAAITDGSSGAYAITLGQILQVATIEVEVVDITGAGDAFAGALAFGLAARWGAEETLRLGSVVAGLSTTRLGARAGLPRMEVVRAILDSAPPVVTRVA